MSFTYILTTHASDSNKIFLNRTAENSQDLKEYCRTFLFVSPSLIG